MPKKQQQPQVEPTPEPEYVAPRRPLEEPTIWQPAEDEPFQLGEYVAWKGSGRYADRERELELVGRAGEVVNATYCNMFGDVTNRIVRFDVGAGKAVWVRANVSELEYA